MNETNAMRLLVDANPVRAEDLAALTPALVSSRRRPSGRMVLALAVAAGAVAASLVGILAFGGTNTGTPRSGGTQVPGIARPIPPQPIPLSAASAALGAPVILPDTLDPSDVGSVTKTCSPADVKEVGCAIVVEFPSQAVTIRYVRVGPTYINPLPDDEASVQEDTDPGRALVYVGGVPALLLPRDLADRSPTASDIEFQVGETSIAITGRNYDGPTVEKLAKSIVDQYPPTTVAHGEAALSEASKVLGAPLALPDTSVVGPSDAASMVSTECPTPHQDPSSAVCQVTVDFPSKSLTLRLIQPIDEPNFAPPQPPTAAFMRLRYQAVVDHNQVGAQLLDLDGTPALFVPAQSNVPAWIEFVSLTHGTDTLIQGPYDEATLQAMAQSIVDQSQSQ